MIGVALDANIGLYLGEGSDPVWAQRLLDDVNRVLATYGMPAHDEPRTAAPGVDPCDLDVRLGFYGSEKYQRLAGFARYLAVFGLAPTVDLLHSDVVDDEYTALRDRRLAFDHLIATTGMDTVVLPQPFDEVLWVGGEFGQLVSAPRLREECVGLAFALRYVDSPAVDWLTDSSVERVWGADRIEEKATQSWAEEADLCHRLLTVATNVLRTGALAITG